MGKRDWQIIGFSVAICCCSGISVGQTTAPTSYPVVIQPWPYPDEQPRLSWMKRGDVDLSIGAEGVTLDTHDHDTLGFLTLGGGYHFTGRVSGQLQLGLSGGEVGDFTYADGQLEDAYVKLRAIGGLASVRYEFLRARGVGLFVDGGVGYLSGHGGFLPGRAEGAWEEEIGAGVMCRVAANVYLAGGVRYVRFSPELVGQSRDRSANGVGYWLSVMFRL
jgi:outer membrane protein with beta-barrel domain